MAKLNKTAKLEISYGRTTMEGTPNDMLVLVSKLNVHVANAVAEATGKEVEDVLDVVSRASLHDHKNEQTTEKLDELKERAENADNEEDLLDVLDVLNELIEMAKVNVV